MVVKFGSKFSQRSQLLINLWVFVWVKERVLQLSLIHIYGVLVPVTVLEAGPCSVTQIKTVENDGYSAVQVAYADKKEKVCLLYTSWAPHCTPRYSAR